MLFFDFVHVSVHGGSWQRGKFYWGYLIYNVLIKKSKVDFYQLTWWLNLETTTIGQTKGSIKRYQWYCVDQFETSTSPPPRGNPRAFELWILKIGLCKFPPPGQKLCSNASPTFIFKGKISDRNFLHIDQALKPRRCRPFLLSHLPARVNYLP